MALPEGQNYGWGLCGAYLRKELAKIAQVEEVAAQSAPQNLDAALFYALEGVSLKPWTKARGKKNVGYVFFENELDGTSLQNAAQSDLILGGSTWCCERMKDEGVGHCDVLLQGVDPEIFHAQEDFAPKDKFVIFSGGKFELRKGQDVVLKAFSCLQDKYPDLHLVTTWHNQWPDSLKTMKISPHIRFDLQGESWKEQLHYLCALNGIDASRVQVCPLMPQHKMPGIIARTHLGIFPNRCEGGTNLVLMEYMACGKPAIATYSSGHRDILSEQNSILLKSFNTLVVNSSSGKPMIRWDDPSLDEVVAAIEHAYHYRGETKKLGLQAAEDLRKMTWSVMAEKLMNFIGC